MHRYITIGVVLLLAVPLLNTTSATEYHSTNFTVVCRQENLAQAIARAAEYYRREVALYWFGREEPVWTPRVKILVNQNQQSGPRGQASFQHISAWSTHGKIVINSDDEDLLAIVLPHEISHCLLSSYLKREPPLWINEGMAQMAEDSGERKDHVETMYKHFAAGKGAFKLKDLFGATSYPKEKELETLFYAQSYSVCLALLSVGSSRDFVRFLEIAVERGFEQALVESYQISIEDCEQWWHSWVRKRMPENLRIAFPIREGYHFKPLVVQQQVKPAFLPVVHPHHQGPGPMPTQPSRPNGAVNGWRPVAPPSTGGVGYVAPAGGYPSHPSGLQPPNGSAFPGTTGPVSPLNDGPPLLPGVRQVYDAIFGWNLPLPTLRS